MAQEITVIGLSLEKFKWMLHFVLAEFYFENKLFFVNISPMTFRQGDGKSNDPWPFKQLLSEEGFYSESRKEENVAKIEPGFW